MGLGSLTCYLGFLVPAVFGLGENFYTLNNVTSWEQASRYCTLATPTINYTGFTLDFGDAFEAAVGKYWVGYTTRNLIFQYIGCSHEAGVAAGSTGNFTLPFASPGLCYSACGTDVFGVRKVHCYCFETRLNLDVGKQRCALSCINGGGIPCGGESAVSIFEVADITMSNVTRDPTAYEFCITYYPWTQTFSWKECYWSLRAQRCQTPSGHRLMYTSEGKSWSDSADYCFSRRETNTKADAADAAVADADADDVVDTSGPCWTEYFRSDVVIRTFKDHGTPVQYGYVNIPDTDGQLTLMMGLDKTNLDAICFEKQDSMLITTTIDSTPSTPENTASEKFTTTAMESTASSQESKKEMLPIQIGVPLLILACVTVVMAGVICYRRRQTGSQTQQQTQQQPAINITPTEAGLDETDNYTELNVQYETPDSTYITPTETGLDETHTFTYTELNVQSETPDSTYFSALEAGMNEIHTYTELNVQFETPDSTYFTAPEAGMNETHTYTELNVQSETPDYMNVQSETPGSTYFTAPEAGMNETHAYTELNVQSETPDYMNV